ncbi:MAG: SAM-dependent methyltransferase, partial [Ferruginibacter sp.]
MLNLNIRSDKKELLDDDNIPFADIKQNMKELNTVNKLLGGHKITIEGIKQIIGKKKDDSGLSICEIGCGGGDNLEAISTWCKKNNVTANFIG